MREDSRKQLQIWTLPLHLSVFPYQIWLVITIMSQVSWIQAKVEEKQQKTTLMWHLCLLLSAAEWVSACILQNTVNFFKSSSPKTVTFKLWHVLTFNIEKNKNKKINIRGEKYQSTLNNCCCNNVPLERGKKTKKTLLDSHSWVTLISPSCFPSLPTWKWHQPRAKENRSEEHIRDSFLSARN